VSDSTSCLVPWKSASFLFKTRSELLLIRLDNNSQTYLINFNEDREKSIITLHRNENFYKFLLLSKMETNNEKEFIKYKYACALNILLAKNKKKNEKNKKAGVEDNTLDHSYDDISSSTGLRTATISDIFNGISEAKIYTIDLILKSLGVTYKKFGEILDKLTEKDILQFLDDKKKQKKK